jgi:hypothetical protein
MIKKQNQIDLIRFPTDLAVSSSDRCLSAESKKKIHPVYIHYLFVKFIIDALAV